MRKIKSLLKCPTCGENILKEENNEIILRNRILKVKKGVTIAICPRCKQEVSVPLKLANPRSW